MALPPFYFRQLLHCVFVFFACADTNDPLHIKHKNFAISDTTGLGCFHNGFHTTVNLIVSFGLALWVALRAREAVDRIGRRVVVGRGV